MALDPTTAIGKVRLRVGDYNDLTIFPDTVYQTVLDENSGNVVRASQTMAQYILATLAMRVHEKLGIVEVWGNASFEQYKQFLLLTISNPAFMAPAPIPYGAGQDVKHPLLQFQEDWNNNYAPGTSSQQIHESAKIGTAYDTGYF
jgi:hypothetical protein